jgi:hypothetical protein
LKFHSHSYKQTHKGANFFQIQEGRTRETETEGDGVKVDDDKLRDKESGGVLDVDGSVLRA